MNFFQILVDFGYCGMPTGIATSPSLRSTSRELLEIVFGTHPSPLREPIASLGRRVMIAQNKRNLVCRCWLMSLTFVAPSDGRFLVDGHLLASAKSISTMGNIMVDL